MYRIWSFEHGAWWRPNYTGYTKSILEAGQYTKLEAKSICDDANIMGEIKEEMRPV